MMSPCIQCPRHDVTVYNERCSQIRCYRLSPFIVDLFLIDIIGESKRDNVDKKVIGKSSDEFNIRFFEFQIFNSNVEFGRIRPF